MKRALALIALLAAGCAGGSLKEMPALEPPPEEAEDGCATLVGAWASEAASGPGSATLRRVLMVFDAEGNFSGAAFGGAKTSTIAGRYREMDGAIELVFGGEESRIWTSELDGDALILREGEGLIRLRRIH
jgi:hypothetical protein